MKALLLALALLLATVSGASADHGATFETLHVQQAAFGYPASPNTLAVFEAASNDYWVRFRMRPTSQGYSSAGFVWGDERGDQGGLWYSNMTGSIDLMQRGETSVWLTREQFNAKHQYAITTDAGDLVLAPANAVEVSTRLTVSPDWASLPGHAAGSVTVGDDVYQGASYVGAFSRIAELEARVAQLEAIYSGGNP